MLGPVLNSAARAAEILEARISAAEDLGCVDAVAAAVDGVVDCAHAGWGRRLSSGWVSLERKHRWP